jgi:hypothetical protein
MAPYIENIPPSGPFVPPVVVVEEGPTVKPSGGWPAREFRDVVDRRRISPKVVRIIEEVAESQVQRLETDEQKRFEELARELELEAVEFETQYLQALALKREVLIDLEIERLLKKKLNDEAVLLILLAASI